MDKHLLGILSVFLVIVSSCIENPVEEEIAKDQYQADQSSRTRSTVVTEYEPLPNPYALHVMQGVYDRFSDSGRILEPTDLYVKFMPKDSSELHTLMYDLHLELFDYPLDIRLEEGDEYINPDIPEDDLTWVYTTVRPDFLFPPGIDYEVLELCYIPEDGETISVVTKAEVEVDVEEAAFVSLGYDISPLNTRAKASPTGIIGVDDSNGNYIPLKGVKVRCHNFVKWSIAYTNDSGEYSMMKNYRTNVHYAIVYENIKGFDIWGNWGPIARANHNLGWHSNSGYSKNIYDTDKAWQWAVVNNSAYEYYEMCEDNGILKPPADLIIWVFRNAERSSAPMLGKLDHDIGLNGHSDWLNFFANIGYGSLATIFNQVFKFALPDITIGTEGMNYKSIYQLVSHELSHASHFSKVGSLFWSRYVSYIMTYGAYGDGTGKNYQLCGIGEMWGYFMEYVLLREGVNNSMVGVGDKFPCDPIDKWIYPHVFWDIYKESLLTKKQIFDCLTSYVDTYDELAEALYSKNPSMSPRMEEIFINYNITPNVILPWTYDGITYDTNVVDRTINTSTYITGGHVRMENVTVNSSAKLTLRGMNSIKIDKPFVVNRGGELEIYYSF